MKTTLAFDIYGTLIDTNGVVQALTREIGDDAARFADLWRSKQLEYTFRRGLMREYVDFPQCTHQALQHTCAVTGHDFDDNLQQQLMAVYRKLPAFDDVEIALKGLHEAGYRLVAFSNGTAEAVGALLQHAGIDGYFSDVVSVETLSTYKPNPDVYHMMAERQASESDHTWLVSSNGFDVIGALSTGLHAAWVKRDPDAVLDPWGYNPDLIVSKLTELQEGISALS